MSDPEIQTQPLIGAQSQPIYVPSQSVPSVRPSRAYKVAGLTMLACVLIVGQAMVAYFLLTQKNEIKSLEEQNNQLQKEMTKGRSGASGSMSVYKPMNALSDILLDDPEDKEPSHEVPSPAPPQATICQLEEAGVNPMPVPGYRPACDERGLYKLQQCYMGQCWCVNAADGREIPGSTRRGPAGCGTAVPRGRKGALTHHIGILE